MAKTAENLDQKTVDQNDKTKDQNSPAIESLTKAVQELQQQNKLLADRLQEKDNNKKVDEEKAAKAKLEDDSDIKKLLEDLEKGQVEEKRSQKKVSLDELSNSELLDVVGDTVDRLVSARMKLAEESSSQSFESVNKNLKTIEGFLGNMVASQTVASLKTRYPDFADHTEQIAKLLKETPGLSIENAYKLAKVDTLEREPLSFETDTEFPDIPVQPRTPSRSRKEPKETNAQEHNTTGLANFRSFTNDALDRVLSHRQR